MTEILHLAIDGLAGRTERLSLTLTPDVNIFFGLNGSGKTSLLKLIFSALQNDVSHIRRVPFARAEVTFRAPELSPKPITRTITSEMVARVPAVANAITVMSQTGPIQIPQTLPQQGWESDNTPSGPVPVAYLSISRLFGDPAGGFWSFGGAEASPYSETRLDQQFFQLIMNRWTNYNSSLLSRVRDLQEEGIAGILESIFSAQTASSTAAERMDVGEAYEAVRHFVERRSMALPLTEAEFTDAFTNDSRLQRAVAEIRMAEDRIKEAELPVNALEELIQRFVTTNKEITFAGGSPQVHVSSGDIIGIDLLSSGEKQLLRILIECLSSPGHCLLLDEPELSLHIDWQHELVGAMRAVNPALQLLVATHSPEIMADVADDRIFEI